jgi:hypothetical protein
MLSWYALGGGEGKTLKSALPEALKRSPKWSMIYLIMKMGGLS